MLFQDELIQIKLFGCFRITRTADGETRYISDEEHASRKCCTLLEYLILNRSRPIPRPELAEALWPESDHAAALNTLKTLVHRTRAMLDKLGPGSGARMLAFKNGMYLWNPSCPVQIDAEEFTALLDRARRERDAEAALNRRIEALGLYTGDLLPRASGELWTVPLVSYYHEQYLETCLSVCPPLAEAGRWKELSDILQTAVKLEPYDEDLNIMLLRALIALDARQLAIQYYNNYTDLLMSQLGVLPSDRIVDVYRELVQTTHAPEGDLGAVRERMSESEESEGAYYCEYEIFREIFRISARRAARDGRTIQLAMLTAGGTLTQRQLVSTMDRLGRVIASTLRTGDVYTRYSASQYLLMLPSASYEDGENVMHRVIRCFGRSFPKSPAELRASLRPMLPKE